VGFDIVFGLQHWVFYPAENSDEFGRIVRRDDEEGRRLLPDGSRDEREHGTISFVPSEVGIV